MALVTVKNLHGTSDNNPPDGYDSFQSFWEDETGRKFGFCSCSSCINDATCGAHVKKVFGGNEWYIVPLCDECNKKDDDFEVPEDDLVPVNE